MSKTGGKAALMMTSCEAMPVSDHERIACGLHIASRGLSAALTRAVQPHGLNGMEANLLLKLRMGLTSPSEIAKYIGIDASNLSRLMRKLEKAELISRAVDEDNRSRIVIELTPRGEALAAKIEPDVRAMEKDVLAALTETDLQRLKKILQKMCVSLTKE